MDELMAIGEFSRRTGLSPKRLRTYAAAGLLTPAAVDAASGYRYYAPGQLRDAALIDTLRRAGVPLTEIAAVLRHPSLEALDTWARQVADDASQRQDALAAARRLLVGDLRVSPPVDEESGGVQMARLRTAVRSETGPVRENNEDAVLGNERLVAVADGMGGGPGGEIAAALAVSLLDAAFTGGSLGELKAAARAANRAVWDRARATPGLGGMGTTLCAAGLTRDGRLLVVNAGDSRAYLLRDGTLTRLTEDHTLTAELVRRGELNEAAAADHPQRNVLTRALGVGPDVDIDGRELSMTEDDRLMVCSDGIFNEVADDEITSLVASAADIEAAASGILSRAMARGGRDNASVVVAELSS